METVGELPAQETAAWIRLTTPCLFGRPNKDLFKTNKIGEIPVELPNGVSRPNPMAYKGLAKAATLEAPEGPEYGTLVNLEGIAKSREADHLPM